MYYNGIPENDYFLHCLQKNRKMDKKSSPTKLWYMFLKCCGQLDVKS